MEILGIILVLVIIVATWEISRLGKQQSKLKDELFRTQASEYSFKQAMKMAQEDKIRIAGMNTELKGKVTAQGKDLASKNVLIAELYQQINEMESRMKVLEAGQSLMDAIEKDKLKQENKRIYARGELYDLMKEFFVSRKLFASTVPTGVLKRRFKTTDSSLHHTINNLIKDGIIEKTGHGEYMTVNKPLDKNPKKQ